jgi:predicted NACHT family NTPase
MARTSLLTSAAGLQQASKAFKLKGWTQEYLAGTVGCSRQVIINFFARRSVDHQLFRAICTELGLEWVEIAELYGEMLRPRTNDLDDLVKIVRSQTHQSIQKRCGTMRVLDMEQPITLDSIYTSVNILEKISRNQRRSIDELLDGCDLENFDRLSLGRVQQKRISGLEAVERHDKLLILGKPGAGKTTFLKWLTLQCNAGRLHQSQVPIFVPLKEFAESPGKPSLSEFMARQLTGCGIENAQTAVEQILQAGRSLVLLDGLDEVQAEDNDRVLNTIFQTSRQFDANQFVMTCRLAAKEYTFEQFTEVEVADFDNEQIADFAHKWFQTKDPTKAKEFPEELDAHQGLRELATNPLLLTLLCLIFGERAGFPANRSELYEEGVDVLLKKWDGKRNIKRDVVYKELSLHRKEDLLSQVAFTAFERSDYFFKQKFVEEIIRDYIYNLPNANTDPEALQLDSEGILKSIEAQHGLLVERARGIYSFSHLTFQEYFTARHFKEKLNGDFGNLVSHITEKRWREVFLLTAGMLKNADELLQAMKHQIDQLLVGDNKLQQFLDWIEHKSNSVNASYKPSAVRAFYFALVHDLANDLANDLDLDLSNDLALAHDLVLTRVLARVLAYDPAHDLVLARVLDLDLDLDLARDPQLKRSLQALKAQLPEDSKKKWENFNQWWKTEGKEWTEHLRSTMIQHRDIGHDWHFSDDQTQLLRQYYDANKVLVNCLNSDCYVSRAVRQEIEDTLLLPVNRQE